MSVQCCFLYPTKKKETFSQISPALSEVRRDGAARRWAQPTYSIWWDVPPAEGFWVILRMWPELRPFTPAVKGGAADPAAFSLPTLITVHWVLYSVILTSLWYHQIMIIVFNINADHSPPPPTNVFNTVVSDNIHGGPTVDIQLYIINCALCSKRNF